MANAQKWSLDLMSITAIGSLMENIIPSLPDVLNPGMWFVTSLIAVTIICHGNLKKRELILARGSRGGLDHHGGQNLRQG